MAGTSATRPDASSRIRLRGEPRRTAVAAAGAGAGADASEASAAAGGAAVEASEAKVGQRDKQIGKEAGRRHEWTPTHEAPCHLDTSAHRTETPLQRHTDTTQ